MQSKRALDIGDDPPPAELVDEILWPSAGAAKSLATRATVMRACLGEAVVEELRRRLNASNENAAATVRELGERYKVVLDAAVEGTAAGKQEAQTSKARKQTAPGRAKRAEESARVRKLILAIHHEVVRANRDVPDWWVYEQVSEILKARHQIKRKPEPTIRKIITGSSSGITEQ